VTARRLHRHPVLLAGSVVIFGSTWAFLWMAGEVLSGETRQFDEWLLQALRNPADPSQPVGPRWLASAALDITALGGPVVLGLTVLAVSGYLLLHGLYRTGLFVFTASVGGWVLNWALKSAFDRPRPDIVPHLREVMTSSFPSGHALTSAAVYMTLGVLVMRIARTRTASSFALAVAVLVTVLVGASRVFLGVHYPSDVLAGWLVGLSWALLCLMTEIVLEHRAGLRREQQVGLRDREPDDS
jgi:undecaprenyl-diphosphatase